MQIGQALMAAMPTAGKISLATALLLPALAACAGTGTSQRIATRAWEAGEQVYVGCQQVPLHETADGYSTVKATLRFGTPIVVDNLAATYTDGRGNVQPSWLAIRTHDNQGFMSARCVVDEAMLQSQQPATASQKAAQQAAANLDGGRGFSDDESGGRAGGRGMMGAGTIGSRNMAVVDRAVQNQSGNTDPAADQEFRKEGHLGEFSGL